MNSLTQRVAAVRDELGKLLADDSDMRAMCLTMREQEAAAAEERHHSWGREARITAARPAPRGVRGAEKKTNRHAPRRRGNRRRRFRGCRPARHARRARRWDGDDDDVGRAAADDRDVVALAFVSARGVARRRGDSRVVPFAFGDALHRAAAHVAVRAPSPRASSSPRATLAALGR